MALAAADGKAYQREYYKRNRERLLARAAERYDPDAKSEYDRQYREDNAEIVRRKKAEYRRTHCEVVRASKDRYRSRHTVRLTQEDRALSVQYRKAIRHDPCFYCGSRLKVMHVDHMQPLSRGGTDHWWNLVRACASCNLSKGAKTAEEFMNLKGGG